MLDIIPIITKSLNDLNVFQKVYSPDFFTNEGEKIPLPSISIVQRGGGDEGYHRVLFRVRGTKIAQTRPLAISVISAMEELMTDELKWQEVNGGLEDKLEKGGAETLFYMLFYEKDSK